MKFQTLALAAALAFGGAAFAATTDTAPASPAATHAKVKHHAARHAAKHAAKKHHTAMRVAKHHQMHERSASLRTDVNSGSRDARMDEALRKFRTSHS